MTATLTRPAPVEDATPTRASTWRSSWSVALRMARRDVRRHKGRSLVVLLMVGIPTALLVFGLTFAATSQVTGPERIPFELGDAQARIQAPTPQAIEQGPDGMWGGGEAKEARPLPGYDPNGDLASQQAAIASFFKGTATPWLVEPGRTTIADRSVRLEITTTDGRAGLGSVLALTSGRWPAAAGETVVSQTALDRGLPKSGTIAVTSGTTTRQLQVVGTVRDGSQFAAQTPSIFVLEPFNDSIGQIPNWLITRSSPVLWSEVREANRYGLAVVSADVLRHPPADSELTPAMQEQLRNERLANQSLLVAGGSILLLVTTLLVGPAFAVSAARQRRTLALAAANGASTPQLRRSVLAQAVVLGVLAAVAGSALGIGATALVNDVILPKTAQYYTSAPFDIPVVQVLAVTAAAVLSALIAALLPARRLGRLDIVGVMKGQNVSPKLSRALPILGAIGAVGGGFLLFHAVTTRGNEIEVVGGAVLLIGGALLLVPMLLVVTSRLAAHLPVSLRMAARDAARQRSRSGPSVAAVVGALAALTMLAVGLSSDTVQQARDYQPQNIKGQATAWLDPSDSGAEKSLTADIKDVDANLIVTPLKTAEMNWYPGSGAQVNFVSTVPDGCTAERIIKGDPTEVVPEGSLPKCASTYGTMAPRNFGNLGVLPAEDLGLRLGLTADQVAGLKAGGVVLVNDKSTSPTVKVTHGTMTQDATTGEIKSVTEAGQITVPVVARLALTKELAPALAGNTGFFATPETAAKAGWKLATSMLLVRDPDGAISADTEERVNAALGAESSLFVERGFQRDDALVMSIIVGIFAFLVLVITLTSTALSLAEQQRDDATLAALGATRGTRRGMAAAQAFVVAGLGALIGFAVGIVPGIAITYPLTGTSQCDIIADSCMDTYVDPTIVIPWFWLAVAIIGVPVLAALIAAASIRRAPLMTRRAT